MTPANLRLLEYGMAFRSFPGLLVQAAKEFQRDSAARLAAALAYYTVFSLAPLLVIAVAVAGRFLGEQAVQGELVSQIAKVTGEDTARFVERLIAQSAGAGRTGIAAALGIGVLLYGASRVFVELKEALNAVWEVKPPTVSVVRSFLRDRLVSFLMVLVIGFLLLTALIANTVAAAAVRWSAAWIPLPAPVMVLIGSALLVLFATLFCALIYKILPDCVVRWRDVWIGAFTSAVLYAVAQIFLQLYFSSGAMTSTYGAAASIVVILVWLNLSAQILLFGAEVVQVYTANSGGEILELPEGPSLTAKLLPFEHAARLSGARRRKHTGEPAGGGSERPAA